MSLFDGKPGEAALYEVLLQALRSHLGPFDVDEQKTQITFRAPKVFGCVSLKGKNGLIVTFGLPSRVASSRIWQAVEPHPNRWTHHVRIRDEAEIDDELLQWLQAAYVFAQTK